MKRLQMRIRQSQKSNNISILSKQKYDQNTKYKKYDLNHNNKLINKSLSHSKLHQKQTKQIQNTGYRVHLDTASQVLARNKKQLQILQKNDINKNQKLFNKVIFFQNILPTSRSNFKISKQGSIFRVQAYFSDKTCLSWKGNTIIYLSLKGIKSRVNFIDFYRSDDLTQKIMKVVEQINRHSDFYITLEESLKVRIQKRVQQQSNKTKNENNNNNKNKTKEIFKKYKIEQFYWQKSTIKQTSSKGYQISSNDQNAILILFSDLFRIRIQYLQLTQKRKIKSSQKDDSSDEDNILDKYTFHPPVRRMNQKSRKQSQILYEYKKVQKYYSIFNLPQRWYYPIDQIWTYLLVNKIVKHDFMYIDFIEQQICISKTTKMPPIFIAGQNLNEQQNSIQSLTNLPLYGKPTHNQKCRWISFKSQSINNQFNQRMIWLNSQSDQNIFYDGYGFWKSSNDGNSVLYKKTNCFQNIFKYHFNAIPLTIRMPNQPERTLQQSISIFDSYIQHNKKLENQPANTKQLTDDLINKRKNNQNQIILQQNIPQIGTFKVYGSGMVIGKFIDKTFLTLKGQIVSIIDENGQTLQINIIKKQLYADKTYQSNTRNPYVKYRQHLNYVIEYYERVFHYEEWIRKQQIMSGLDNLRIANQAFIQVCQNIKNN